MANIQNATSIVGKTILKNTFTLAVVGTPPTLDATTVCDYVVATDTITDSFCVKLGGIYLCNTDLLVDQQFWVHIGNFDSTEWTPLAYEQTITAGSTMDLATDSIYLQTGDRLIIHMSASLQGIITLEEVTCTI